MRELSGISVVKPRIYMQPLHHPEYQAQKDMHQMQELGPAGTSLCLMDSVTIV